MKKVFFNTTPTLEKELETLALAWLSSIRGEQMEELAYLLIHGPVGIVNDWFFDHGWEHGGHWIFEPHGGHGRTVLFHGHNNDNEFWQGESDSPLVTITDNGQCEFELDRMSPVVVMYASLEEVAAKHNIILDTSLEWRMPYIVDTWGYQCMSLTRRQK